MSEHDLGDSAQDELGERRRLTAAGRTGSSMLSERLAGVTRQDVAPVTQTRSCGTCGKPWGTIRRVVECTTCEGERTRRAVDRAADAIREYKRLAERGDEERAREAWLQVIELAGRSYADGLRKVVEERVASARAGSRPRRGLD